MELSTDMVRLIGSQETSDISLVVGVDLNDIDIGRIVDVDASDISRSGIGLSDARE